jgi:hypothetical protein
MKDDRAYSAGTREALFMLSRGHCYEPDCRARVMRSIDGHWRTNAHIAHICGLNQGSARFDESMTLRERNNFRNLLLVCKPHHDQIDDRALESRFPPELLVGWKSAREGDYADDLYELDWVTEDMLKGWMTEAVADTRDEITAAFDRLQDLNSEFLSSLRQAALDFFDLPYLDADDIRSLHYTATVFRSIPDYASMLDSSAQDLHHLPSSADMLSLIAHNLEGLPSSADLLHMAARAIEQAGLPEFVRYADGIESSVRSLTGASSELSRAAELVEPVPGAAADIRDASARLERAALVLRSGRSWSWKEFWWGTVSCGVFVIAVLALWSHIVARK